MRYVISIPVNTTPRRYRRYID